MKKLDKYTTQLAHYIELNDLELFTKLKDHQETKLTYNDKIKLKNFIMKFNSLLRQERKKKNV